MGVHFWRTLLSLFLSACVVVGALIPANNSTFVHTYTTTNSWIVGLVRLSPDGSSLLVNGGGCGGGRCGGTYAVFSINNAGIITEASPRILPFQNVPGQRAERPTAISPNLVLTLEFDTDSNGAPIGDLSVALFDYSQATLQRLQSWPDASPSTFDGLLVSIEGLISPSGAYLALSCVICGENSERGLSLYSKSPGSGGPFTVVPMQRFSAPRGIVVQAQDSTRSIFACEDDACVLVPINSTSLGWFARSPGDSQFTLRAVLAMSSSALPDPDMQLDWRVLSVDWSHTDPGSARVAATLTVTPALTLLPYAVLWTSVGDNSYMNATAWSNPWLFTIIVPPASDFGALATDWTAPDPAGVPTLLVTWANTTSGLQDSNNTAIVVYSIDSNASGSLPCVRAVQLIPLPPWPFSRHDYDFALQTVFPPTVSTRSRIFIVTTLSFISNVSAGWNLRETSNGVWANLASVPSSGGNANNGHDTLTLALSVAVPAAVVVLVAVRWRSRVSRAPTPTVREWKDVKARSVASLPSGRVDRVAQSESREPQS